MNCDVKYYHIPTANNIADKGTREDCGFEYLSSKEWQHGPEFIKELEPTATLALTIAKNAVHADVNYVMVEKAEPENNVLDSLVKRSNNLKTALRAICIVKSILKRKSFKGKVCPSKKDMQSAMMTLIKRTQESSGVDATRTKQLVTFKEDGVVFTKMRFPEPLMSSVFGKNQLPVLPATSNVGQLPSWSAWMLHHLC